MTDLLAARSQMAVSLGFHIIFAALGIAMPLMISIAEWRWLRTGDEGYLSLAKRWSKGTAILFAVGAVSGTVLSFELGLLWPAFMKLSGPMIGPLFALEGFAFFTEAIFLGIYLYGWSLISPVKHFMAGLMVAASGMASAVFVIAVNAWMNEPIGFTKAGEHLTELEPLAVLAQPLARHETIHMLLAAFAATGLLVAGLHAMWLLRDNRSLFHRRALGIAVAMGGIAAVLQLASGHLISLTVADRQPTKLAAMEAHFATAAGADFLLGGLADNETATVRYAVAIPKGLSLLVHGDPSAEVTGLDRVPKADWPPVAVVHLAFQVMVLCGLIMTSLALWSAWRWRRSGRLEQDIWLLRGLCVAAPAGFIAIEAGWVVTEVGRQPWIIDQVMRTSEAVTPMPGLWVPFVTFSLLYLVLGAVVAWAMWRHVAATEHA